MLEFIEVNQADLTMRQTKNNNAFQDGFKSGLSFSFEKWPILFNTDDP